MIVVVIFKLKDEYVQRIANRHKTGESSDTPLSYFLYALGGGLTDYGLDADEVEVLKCIVPENLFVFPEDRDSKRLCVVPAEKFKEGIVAFGVYECIDKKV